jgi:hypothetical protein
MRSHSRSRRGTALVEAAVALPALVASLGVLGGSFQLGLWKLAVDAAANAGAQVLADGGTAGDAETMALTGLHASESMSPTVVVTENGTVGLVTAGLTIQTMLGPIRLGAAREVALPPTTAANPGPSPSPSPTPDPTPNPPRYWPPSHNPGPGRGFVP